MGVDRWSSDGRKKDDGFRYTGSILSVILLVWKESWNLVRVTIVTRFKRWMNPGRSFSRWIGEFEINGEGVGKRLEIYIYIYTSVYLYDLWIESWMLRSRVIGDNKFSNVTWNDFVANFSFSRITRDLDDEGRKFSEIKSNILNYSPTMA